MDAREQRGLAIAAIRKLVQVGGRWEVPSQSVAGRKYVVNPEKKTCSCPDHIEGGFTCKHYFAVQFVIQRELFPDGSVTETATMTVSETVTVRKTYPQQWSAYNAAQTHEKHKFQLLLRELCHSIPHEPILKRGRGRPALPVPDAVFSATFKVYSTLSGRRFMCDLRDAHERGYIAKLPCYNSIFNVLENPDVTPILNGLVAASSLPLKSIEANFACDSSGFSTSRFQRWYDHKYGCEQQQREWVKCHIMCGVKTNVVTAVEILDKRANDCPQLPKLLAATAKTFKIAEVSADKGYLSADNFEEVAKYGAVPFIAFKNNSTDAPGGTWGKMWHYVQFHRDYFLSRYHQRSNVESTFSMIKAKFGDAVRSKTDVAMKNEVLCKLICHNVCCVIQSMYEAGVDPITWAEVPVAQQSSLPA